MNLKPSAYDSNNKKVTCDECEKSAGFFIMAQNGQIAKCCDHYQSQKIEWGNEEKLQKHIDKIPPLLQKDWVKIIKI